MEVFLVGISMPFVFFSFATSTSSTFSPLSSFFLLPHLQALSWLLTVPGASNTVIEARVPYGGVRSWADALGGESDCPSSSSSPLSLPRSLASAPAAAALAEAAYRQAAQLSPFPSSSSSSSSSSPFESPQDILGVGCSCALATGRERAGSDRVFVAAHGAAGVFSASAELLRPPRGDPAPALPPPREAQDALASRLLLRTLGAAVGCEALASLSPTGGGSGGGDVGQLRDFEERFEAAEDPVAALLAGRASSVELGAGFPAVVDAPRGRGRVYLSGSFNPLHAGHEGLLAAAVAAAEAEAAAAARESGGADAVATTGNGAPSSSSSSLLPIEGAFELSVVNADKGTLTDAEVRRRVEQFSNSKLRFSRVVLTRAPLFEEKASLFGRGASFAVGVDTAVRLLDPKYYFGGSDAGLGLSMGGIAARGARVFVAGRKAAKDGDDGGGGGVRESFLTLSGSGALASSPAARAVASLGLFREIPEGAFRADVSSTELRERAKKEAMKEAAAREKD